MSTEAVHVFTGENVFALEEALSVWVSRFVEKHGRDNLVRLDAKESSLRDIFDHVGVAPFLAGKRLVIVRGTPKLAREDIDVLFATIHPEVVLLFAEPKFDQRLGGVKELFKRAKVETFAPLAAPQLLSWAQDFAKRRGAVLPPASANALLQIVGEDQQLMAAELEKICLFAAGRSITKEDVDALALPGEGSQWHLTDLLTDRKVDAAILYAQDLAKRGQDAFAVWNILLWMIRTLVLVHGCAESRVTQAADVARSAGVPWRRVQPLLKLQKELGPAKILAIVDEAVRADTALKNGGYRATGEETQELQGLIDRLILRFA